VGNGVVTGLGVASATPLIQMIFLPVFTQVYRLPLTVAVIPTFLQVSPAFMAALAFIGVRRRVKITTKLSVFFI
jgi:hypothetical protein